MSYVMSQGFGGGMIEGLRLSNPPAEKAAA
jgi:hypothetical protein